MIEIDSKRVSDQTSEEWSKGQACQIGDGAQPHSIISVKVASELIPYVEQCEYCGYINPEALQAHAENAIKNSLSARAQRIAVAVETEPFRFVQPPSGDLDLGEILLQALAAAAETGTRDQVRPRSIYKSLRAEMLRMLDLARKGEE